MTQRRQPEHVADSHESVGASRPTERRTRKATRAGRKRGPAPRERLVLLAVAVAVALLAWPVIGLDQPALALLVGLPFTAICVTLGRPLRRKSEASAAAALAFFVVIALWRQSFGATAAELAPLGVLPVIWVALYCTRKQLWLVTACAAALFYGPIMLIGGSRYPVSEWRTATLWVLLCSVIGPVIQSVVERARLLEPAGARLAGLLRAATEHAIFETDLEGRITLFNSGAERMVGWPAHDMLGTCLTEVIHDLDEIVIRADELGIEPGFAVLHATLVGGVETRDWTWVTRTRERKTVSLSVTAKRDGNNKLVGYIGIATDVTAVRQAHRALEAQYQIQQLLLEHLPSTTVGLLDKDLRWVTVGGNLPLEMGLTNEELVGVSIDEVLPTQDSAAARAILRDGWTKPVHGELLGTNARTYEVDALPVRGTDRHPLLLTVARDVTEQRLEAERNRAMSAALAVSEQSFRTAFEDAPIGTVLTSADPDLGDRFIRVNTAFAQLLGRSAEDLAGSSVDAVTHRDDRHQQLHQLEPGACRHSLQKRFLHASGQPIWVEMTYSLVRDSRGAPWYYISHVEDINLRKESERSLLAALEQQRAATAALEDLDRIRSDVVANISHELRTPLTSIRGYLEILSDDGSDGLSDEQRRMVQIAGRNAERLAGLVDDLLWLAKQDASAGPPAAEPRRIDLRDLVRTAVTTIEVTAQQRNQVVITTVSDDPVLVDGDAEQLSRAVVNLLANAVKYTELDGRIEIEVFAADGQAHIEVCDDGIGIPADEQSNLFERFFRGAAAQDLAIAGTGLGLAIVKSIVDRHDGSLSVSSSPGHGSRFVMTLPLALVLTGV